MNRRANVSLFNSFFRIGHSVRQSPIPTSLIPFTSSTHIIPASNFHSISKFAIMHNLRSFCGGSSEVDQNKEVDTINLKFVEAREEIDMALESKETAYFNEEAECARAAVNEVVGMFERLLARLPEKDRAALQRSMGLKIEQLKAELQQLDE
uniref:Late embryogenesis abundant protein n=1 Tax=Lotus japonicus TaxID=34305 RepID=I3T868_LOTJA|nr:unknown [Lotus japonicus]